jgi:hypothetical protein
MQNNKGFSNILVISLVLILMGVGGYFGFSYFKKPEVSKSTSENTETQPENENLKYFKASKINSDLDLSGDFSFENDANEAEYYSNDKQELFLEYSNEGAQAVAKLNNGKWVKILSWNGYPDCKTFDNSGVPYEKSTIEYGCVLESDGQPLRASVNKADSIEYCKFQFDKFGEYSESPQELNCKKLMK